MANQEQPYSMSKALELLHDELSKELENFERNTTENKWRDVLSSFHHNSVRTLYHWTSLLGCTAVALLLLVGYGFMNDHGHSENIWVVIEACLILFFVTFNFIITVNTASKEKLEFPRILKETLKNMSTCIRYNIWNKSHFPNKESPHTPCYSLQWTLRDEQVYNIPTPLLVRGDIILIRPGHPAPCRCKLIQTSDESLEQILDEGETFSPNNDVDDQSFTTPQSRVPLQPHQFILLETPYLKLLRHVLTDTHRPPSILEHEKFEILNKWIERKILPAIFVVSLIVNIIRYWYMRGHVGQWSEVIIILQLHTVVPLLPILLPGMWLVLNCYGEARVFSSFEAAKGTKSLSEDSFDTDSSISADEVRVDIQWRQILSWFKSILLGKADAVSRKINITHILGSVTTLCCVDKKGILSHPNPTPEKVFFLRNGKKDLSQQVSTTTADVDPEVTDTSKGRSRNRYSDTSQRHVEVLDITSNPKRVTVHFDDPTWKNYLSSLKPLGLNILANTCNKQTVQWYTKFTDHVAYAGLENQETVAVVNRRCMCALAKEIGFSEKALEIFQMEKMLGLYRQVSAEMTTKERLQRAKSFVQHKIPMPNMVSVLMKEKISGSCQLLSQGTADILLSCCSDVWDGDDLEPLTEIDRKRILDFYQRASIGSYCTAFSYCPVRQNIISVIKDSYIELPDESVKSYLNDHMHSSYIEPDLESLGKENRGMWETPRSFSADSLFDSSSITSEENSIDPNLAQRNQVFIGMVTMQYQARQDFIQLIDKLEGACIRFVHFSQENEVRSRVFAEKMGLEAGWNCHISLRSEKQYLSGSSSGQETSQMDLTHRSSKYCANQSNDIGTSKGDNPPVLAYMNKQSKESSKCKSQSAPSIVHLASSQVKFEKKVKTALVSPRKVKRASISQSQGNTDEELTPLHQKTDDNEIVFDYDLTDYPTWGSDEELSRQASSYITENTDDSLTGVLDNRAKLPRGIENIRPHLKSIDNVPLLVNLFTDCTTETTFEMITIMQEHGEVVLCAGSSTNMQNIPIFLQADCSIGLEPLCPQVCMRQSSSPFMLDKTILTPLQLASSLLSVVCPLHINQEDNISLIHLIAESRCHLMSMRNCFYFIMCCSLSVSFAQVLATFCQLPPVLSAHHILWLVLFVIPLLGITMLGNPVDARVMSLATRKNANHITKEMILQFMGYNVLRFLLPVLAGLFCFSLTLHSYCQTLPSSVADNSTMCGIYDFLYTAPYADRTWYDKFSGGLVLAQNIFLFLLLLYFEIISLSFVHWTDHLWQQFPATNKLWLIITPVLFCCQVLFCVCDVSIRNQSVSNAMSLADVHPAVWAVGLGFPVLMVVINELLKHREIKLAVRYQKRARLDFGTKLGMNSPF